ncbi:phosphoglycerate mutase, partial [Nannochloropsis gaditana CCMP526]|uniref:phosphoglycerate mutase n=1 Tax=Nannochloropsis gaditana (strain CCMP526) TaxID=1093141 RepID=UPI00029F6072
MLPFSPPSHPAKRKHFATSPLVVFYIIRHGESTGNRQGILQGQRDYPLTDTGRQQAQETGRRLRQDASLQDLETGDVSCFFDRIYSSDLTRAKNTAEIIVEELTGGKRQPSKDPSHHGSNDTSSNTCHNDDNANDIGLESLLTLDTDLREISGGAREGQPLGLSLQEAMRRTALKQV